MLSTLLQKGIESGTFISSTSTCGRQSDLSGDASYVRWVLTVNANPKGPRALRGTQSVSDVYRPPVERTGVWALVVS